MAVFLRTVTVVLAVNEVSMSVEMRVLSLLQGRNRLCYPAHDPREIQSSQENQHQAHGKFHREANSCRDHKPEQDDCRTNSENRDRVTQAPERANQRRLADASLTAHNGRYGDDMVRISRVAHAEKKTKRKDGEKRDHLFRPQQRRCWPSARSCSESQSSGRGVRDIKPIY